LMPDLAGFLFGVRLPPFPLWKVTSEPRSRPGLFFGVERKSRAPMGGARLRAIHATTLPPPRYLGDALVLEPNNEALGTLETEEARRRQLPTGLFLPHAQEQPSPLPRFPGGRPTRPTFACVWASFGRNFREARAAAAGLLFAPLSNLPHPSGVTPATP
jgi:hypothetical protein